MKKESTAGTGRKNVLLLQIDGLPLAECRRAVAKGQLKTLAELILLEGWTLRRFYSGLPSSTPAVQAEIIYGVRSAVPAFGFYDRENNKRHSMFNEDSARFIEEQLETSHRSILQGGGSYSNIYTGGAAESTYTAPNINAETLAAQLNPFRLAWVIVKHPLKTVWILWMVLVELLLAVKDAFKGILSYREVYHELKFITARVGVCILLREVVEVSVIEGLKDGLPVLHANFLGFDEQAHRRGPQSAFARWTLKGIDGSIRKILQANDALGDEKYEVIIFSDHGQEHVIPYPDLGHGSISESVRRILEECLNLEETPTYLSNASAGRNRLLWDALCGLVFQNPEEMPPLVVRAQGPLGHIYCRRALTAEEKLKAAVALAKHGEIPHVFYFDEEDQLMWVGKNANRPYRDAVEDIFGTDHPALEMIIDDFEELCRSRYVGDWIISGWRKNEEPISFPIEHGAHGGIGREETSGFLLIPGHLKEPFSQRLTRPRDLHNYVMTVRNQTRDQNEGSHV